MSSVAINTHAAPLLTLAISIAFNPSRTRTVTAGEIKVMAFPPVASR
jgi:hypothetical protein